MALTPETIALCKDAALANGLEPSLVCAIVEQESGGNPWLSRYEQGFFNKYLDKSSVHLQVQDFCRAAKYTVSFDTELRERAYSRGLMQVMGQVARERGFAEPLPKLHDPATGLAVGCQHLARLLLMSGGVVRLALLRWNGGGNPNYPERVISRKDKYANA